MDSLKNRLVEFLKEDLNQIESNSDIMKHDIMQSFVSYWQQHCKSLKD